ncbi:helix-turn-helix domain-containing protein [Sphingopyxis sp. 22461]|uniref:helix-turn-helix domain-containing protein n=1 Tax=Sphingopyxis sp. 22461 TaxID=3453923 RepID=UPI003F85EA58
MSAKEMVTAHLDARTAKIQVSDFIWNEGEEIHQVNDDFIIGYRPYPSQVTVAAKLKSGRLQSFGQLMFFPAKLEVVTDPANCNERVRNVRCHLDADWLRQIWRSMPQWESSNLSQCFDMRNFRIEQTLQRLGHEALNPGFASTLMVESLSNTIAIEIVRHFNASSDSRRVRTQEGKLSDADIARIVEYIDSCENHCPNIDEIANVCDISSAHLRRSFKRTTGRTVHDAVERIRLRKAQDLLISTDLPLKVISYRLGFANSSTFSSTFRRSSSETPSEYRRRLRA